jgi:hypothetical protein
MVAWSGLSIPVKLTKEQHNKLKSKYAFPPGGNKKLQEFFKISIIQGLFDQGYGPTEHFRIPPFHSLSHPEPFAYFNSTNLPLATYLQKDKP